MKYAACIEYDGTPYFGWQRLSHGPSVQAEVEKALSQVANQPIDLTCAGRTDSGVHGIGQIVHFDSDVDRNLKAWKMGCNRNLPDDISMRWIQEVDNEFELMHQAAQLLLGENDFSSFRAAGCQAKHAMRELQSISVTREGQYVYVDIVANAFLHHMVRNIVGSLFEVGKGAKPVAWFSELLAIKDRNKAGITAPACGLYFVSVEYPEQFELPAVSAPPYFGI